MTPNLTKEEIDALKQELQEQREKQAKRVKRAVNPGLENERIMKR